MEYRIKLRLQRFTPALAARFPEWFCFIDSPVNTRFWSSKRTAMCPEPAIKYSPENFQHITGADYIFLPGGTMPPVIVNLKNIEKLVNYDS